jgi:hypothetical protein
MGYSVTENALANTWLISQTEDLPTSFRSLHSRLLAFSTFIPGSWSYLLSKMDQTDRIPFSDMSCRSHLGGASRFTLSEDFDSTTSRLQSTSASEEVAAAGSRKLSATALSIGGTMSGLLVASMAGAALFFVIRKKRRSEETTIDIFDEGENDAFRTMTSLESCDEYLSQENTGQIETGHSLCSSSSLVIE